MVLILPLYYFYIHSLEIPMGENDNKMAPSDPDPFLGSTPLIESTHSAIDEKVRSLTMGCTAEADRARALFFFVRDGIRYDFRAAMVEDHYRASYILERGKGFCVQKAILFCAMARNAGIPAALHFWDIRDHSLSRRTATFLKTRILYHHGIVDLWIGGRWIGIDASLDIGLIQRHGLDSVEFFPDRDCLMPGQTNSGKRHIDYINDHGRYADVTFSQIRSRLIAGYPHLFRHQAG
jgi:transglutaminase-like putative cysteine protease